MYLDLFSNGHIRGPYDSIFSLMGTQYHTDNLGQYRIFSVCTCLVYRFNFPIIMLVIYWVNSKNILIEED